MNATDAAELARQRQQRLAAALQASDLAMGAPQSDRVLGELGIATTVRDPENGPEARARNLEQAKALRPDLAREVIAANGDKGVTQAALRAQELSATIPVVVVAGDGYKGPTPVIQGEGLNTGAAKAYIQVADPGSLDHQQVGTMVQTGERSQTGQTRMTGSALAVDPQVMDNAKRGEAADEHLGPDPAADARERVEPVPERSTSGARRAPDLLPTRRSHVGAAFDGLG